MKDAACSDQFDRLDISYMRRPGGKDTSTISEVAIKLNNAYNNQMYQRINAKDPDKRIADQIVTSEQYLKTHSLWDNLDKSADAYLAKKMREKGVTDLKDLVGKNDYEKDRIEYAKRVKQYTGKHKVEAPTKHQEELLKQHDEADLVDFNKKMKEEALKIQKQNSDPQPGL